MSKPKTHLASWALTLLTVLLATFSYSSPVLAATDETKWSRVNIPTEGETGNWVLATGSDIQHLTIAIDGTLYCYANPSGTSYTLFKSTDAGLSWAYVGGVKDIIVDIATAPDIANIVYYATTSRIYKSADAGGSFTLLPLSPGGAGSNNITITSIATTRQDSSRIVAVGTRDTDNSQFGGVYILDENEPFAGWTNTNIGNCDICTVAFSPNFATDRQMVAVVTDENDTIITTRIGDNIWGRITGNATIKGIASMSASIAFPDDYDATNGDYALFVAINAGGDKGDVYKIFGERAPSNSVATDLDIGAIYNLSNIDVNSLAISGNTASANLLAGAANSSQVYISTDGGKNWKRSSKKPTGQSKTGVVMVHDFKGSNIAYATTNGNESAFSYTIDGGTTWNQLSLIDTKIGSITDLAVSSKYSQDNTLFMLTFNSEHSLWRSLNGGAKWERVFTSALASASRIDGIELSPQYNKSSQSLFLAGISGTSPTIWKSVDNGQTFTRQSAPLPINSWAFVDDDTIFLGTYDGSNSLVYKTSNGGLSYSIGAVAGSQTLASIALSPNYAQDNTILAGNEGGYVYYSADNGTSFKTLGQRLATSGGLGKVTVTFDPKFSSNKIVYAISDNKSAPGSKDRIYRFTIGTSDSWQNIDGTIPTGSIINQITLSSNGTLYAINSQTVSATNKQGGLERSLNPTASGPTFETVLSGLDDGAKLNGLWLSRNQIWSVDSTNTKLMTYIDSLSVPVTLTSPYDKAQGIDTTGISLDWEALKEATSYHWELDYENNFPTANITGDTAGSLVRLPELQMATTYYWRVRATKPVYSQWSAKWSFTTTLGTTINAPELYSPKAGDTGVPIKPVFQWSAMGGADRYELLVDTDSSFPSPIIMKIGDYGLPSTAWQSDVSLDYDATYYWKVRATGSNTYSAWSAVSAFTTRQPPSEPTTPPAPQIMPPEPPPSTPSSPPLPSPSSTPQTQLNLPNWVIYVAIILFLTIVLLLVALLMLIVRNRQF